MTLSKEELMESFRKKDYLSCITSLREEIKNILIQRMKIQKIDFEYTSIVQLKEYCLRYLDENEKRAALILYRHSYEEIPEQLELSDLLEVYEILKK